MKNWLIWKDPDAGKDWRQGDKGTTEDEMVGWHHQLDGHEFEPALGVGDGQGSLACCSPWGRKELDTTEQLNWTELIVRVFSIWVLKLTLCFTRENVLKAHEKEPYMINAEELTGNLRSKLSCGCMDISFNLNVVVSLNFTYTHIHIHIYIYVYVYS